MVSYKLARQTVIDNLTNSQLPFDQMALCIYDFQYKYNSVYHQFISLVKGNDFRPTNVTEIPFLPITLFKDVTVKTGSWSEEDIFYSSGTTGSTRSQHHIRDKDWYLNNAIHIWNSHLKSINELHFVGLLPHYYDNPNSSLLCMVKEFMNVSLGGIEKFFVDLSELNQEMDRLIRSNEPVVLMGVSFALLDYASKFQHDRADNLIVVETGGMKKYHREITRTELHDELAKCFQGASIVSEYGMTECLSQMYCLDGMHFLPNDKMRIIISDPTDSNIMGLKAKRGRVNIIDLANLDSISFIATDDLGMIHPAGIEIFGRLTHSDLRGCNYLI